MKYFLILLLMNSHILMSQNMGVFQMGEIYSIEYFDPLAYDISALSKALAGDFRTYEIIECPDCDCTEDYPQSHPCRSCCFFEGTSEHVGSESRFFINGELVEQLGQNTEPDLNSLTRKVRTINTKMISISDINATNQDIGDSQKLVEVFDTSNPNIDFQIFFNGFPIPEFEYQSHQIRDAYITEDYIYVFVMPLSGLNVEARKEYDGDHAGNIEPMPGDNILVFDYDENLVNQKSLLEHNLHSLRVKSFTQGPDGNFYFVATDEDNSPFLKSLVKMSPELEVLNKVQFAVDISPEYPDVVDYNVFSPISFYPSDEDEFTISIYQQYLFLFDQDLNSFSLGNQFPENSSANILFHDFRNLKTSSIAQDQENVHVLQYHSKFNTFFSFSKKYGVPITYKNLFAKNSSGNRTDQKYNIGAMNVESGVASFIGHFENAENDMFVDDYTFPFTEDSELDVFEASVLIGQISEQQINITSLTPFVEIVKDEEGIFIVQDNNSENEDINVLVEFENASDHEIVVPGVGAGENELNFNLSDEDLDYFVIRDPNDQSDGLFESVGNRSFYYFFIDTNHIPDYDYDQDGVDNQLDDCPNTPMGETVNAEGCSDSQLDNDNDGVSNAEDNCIDEPNSNQADQDGDGSGDVCDDDIDGDGVNNDTDNCPNEVNTDQTDTDNDGIGDVCDGQDDSDSDGDGVIDLHDDCPNTPMGETVDSEGCSDSQLDNDNDGVVNAEDNCVDEWGWLFNEGCPLPTTNFQISYTGESCMNEQDAKIEFRSEVDTEFTYHLSKNGSEVSSGTINASNMLNQIDQLYFGEYRLCFTEPIDNFEQCFTLFIEEPEAVSFRIVEDFDPATAKLVDLKGTPPFEVFRNGEFITETYGTSLTVPIVIGENLIEVRSSKNCEGVSQFEIVRDSFMITPNPASGRIVFHGIASESIQEISLITSSGSITTIEDQLAEIDISELASGFYVVRIKLVDDRYLIGKFIKQ